MVSAGVSFTEFAKLFPFFIATDFELKVVEYGPSYKKLNPNIEVGKNLDTFVDLKRPQISIQNLNLTNLPLAELIMIEDKDSKTHLMGQILKLEDQNTILFAVNLAATNADDLTHLNLTYNDFAIQDQIFDYLLLFQTQKRAIEETDKLNSRLAKAHKLAQQASELKSQFLVNMSHELRTPMNGVLGIASLLYETHLDDEQKSYVDTIVKSGEVMMSLVNEILDFGRIEAGDLSQNLREVNVVEVVREVFDATSGAAVAKGLLMRCQVDVGVPQYLIVDYDRLKQALTNLVNNAIKFTQSGSINLSVALVNSSSTRVKFSVKDTGIGVKEEWREKIFQPFVQGDQSMTRQYGGTGLGLSIFKKIVESMGGSISLLTEEGVGSEFSFDLPMAETINQKIETEIQMSRSPAGDH